MYLFSQVVDEVDGLKDTQVLLQKFLDESNAYMDEQWVSLRMRLPEFKHFLHKWKSEIEKRTKVCLFLPWIRQPTQ